MKVIIPLAGKGTRLRPQTYHTPKPLLHVGGRPVMSYILDDLQALGVEEIVFITGHLKESIEEYIGKEYPAFRAHFVEQAVQNGTAGAVKLAQPFIDEDVLIIYVDTLFDADLSLTRRVQDVSGIIWVKEVEDYQRFGVVLHDERGMMRRIVEKPQDPISKLANIGLYYIRDWHLFFQGVDHTLESAPGPSGEYYITDAFQYMIDHGADMLVQEVEGWYDAGQVDTLLQTNRHLLEHAGRALRPAGSYNARIIDPVRIEEGVQLEDAEVGPNVTLESGCVVRGSSVRDCIVGQDVRIENSRLHDSLVGENSVVRGISGSVSLAAHTVIEGEA